MKSIVAVDTKWGIGKNNDLLFSLKGDMRYFREKTSGKIVVMGSNTLKSFPGGNPLKNRVNIVLYPGGEPREDCIIVQSIEELAEELKKYPTDDIFVIGGAMFYHTMLPYVTDVYVTKVNADGDAQVFFDNLDEHPAFTMVEEGEEQEENGITYRFTRYHNGEVKPFICK